MVGILIVIAVVAGIVAVAISAMFLQLAARISNIDNRTYGKALASTVFGGIASTVVTFIIGMIPVVGVALGWVVGFLISALITQVIFQTSFSKALVAAIIHWILSLILIVPIVWFILSLISESSSAAPFLYGMWQSTPRYFITA